jgi:integrase
MRANTAGITAITTSTAPGPENAIVPFQDEREVKKSRGGGVYRAHGAWTASAGFDPITKKRVQKGGFASAADARRWRAQQLAEVGAKRATARELSMSEAADASAAMEALSTNGMASPGILSAAVAEYLARHPKAGVGVTVAAFYAQWLADKKQLRRRPATLTAAKANFKPFLCYREKTLGNVTRADVEKVVFAASSPRAQINRLAVAGNFFAEAQRRGLLGRTPENNPCNGISRPAADDPPPDPFPVDEAQRLLDAAWETEDRYHCTAFVALGLFCGIRTEELLKLRFRPGEIDLDLGLVTVPATIAKKRRARVVVMADNLRAILAGLIARPRVRWSKHCAQHRRPTDPDSRVVSGNRLREFKRHHLLSVGLKWRRNGLRSAYASHYYEYTADLAATLARLGHTGNPTVFHNHYRALIAPGQGAKYFALVPAGLPPVSAAGAAKPSDSAAPAAKPKGVFCHHPNHNLRPENVGMDDDRK